MGSRFEVTVPRADPTAGDLVRIYREEKNWSQKRLAGQMHKSVSWVSQTERGQLPLNDLTVIQRLAAVLGARPQEL
ncbi:MAG: helix-turn-helix transcriptional regulator, partial [Mycobacterium sp.]|nr:helix-turn-helix transcriptional regulator [Mycobacterium sp.]